MKRNTIYQGNSLEVLKTFPDNSVDCCVTSPPYFGLRDYAVLQTRWPEVQYSILGFSITIPAMDCCLGLEKTPEQFIGHLVLIFEEVRRVLKPTGTLWLNMGDSYNGSTHDKLDELRREISDHKRMIDFLERKDLSFKSDLDAPHQVRLDYWGGNGFHCSGKFVTISFPDVEMLKEELAELETKYSKM